MIWDQKGKSIHHRSESTFQGFDNANPSWLGDSKIVLRYLFKNDGMGDGLRFIYGGGISVPSSAHIEYVAIQTQGDGVDFGDLNYHGYYCGGCSNGHGGLG